MTIQADPGRRSTGFAAAVVLCAASGLAAGLFADGTQHPGVYALESLFIYRGEIALASFAALYFVVVLTRLAYYGRTPTSIGTSGTELPDVGRVSEAKGEVQAAIAQLDKLRDDLANEFSALHNRVAAIEQERARGSEHG